MKRTKLALLSVGFFIIALGLFYQNGIGIISYLGEIGIRYQEVVLGFLISSVALAVQAVLKSDYNLLWYTPYMLYCGASWMAFTEKLGGADELPIAMPVLYTLLLIYLCTDWLIERRLSWNKIRSTLSLSLLVWPLFF